jgi:hypothetical protein
MVRQDRYVTETTGVFGSVVMRKGAVRQAWPGTVRFDAYRTENVGIGSAGTATKRAERPGGERSGAAGAVR